MRKAAVLLILVGGAIGAVSAYYNWNPTNGVADQLVGALFQILGGGVVGALIARATNTDYSK